MAALKKENSQMADADGFPLIGPAQAAIADAAEAATNAQLATKINEVIAALEAHGLIKDS